MKPKRVYPLLLIAAVASVVLLTGCPLNEKEARDAVVTAEAFLNKAKENHPECNPDLPADHELIQRFGLQADNEICQAIYDAIKVQNEAVDLLDAYCNGPGWIQGGACNPTDETKKDFGELAKLKIKELNLALVRATRGEQ